MLHLNKKLVLSAAIVASFSLANAADIIGTQSASAGGDHIEVGESNMPFGPHSSNMAGVGVSNTALFGTWMKVDFQGLSTASLTTTVNTGGATVYQLHNPIVNTNPFHRQLGNFNFVKVGSGDVWFGEWSRNNNTPFDGRQVYYVGDRDGTSIPTDAIATYTVKGINKFTGNNLMTGTFTANFYGNVNKLTGSISNQAATLAVNAKIAAGNSGSFDTTNAATFTTAGGVSAVGDVKGNFFGSNAAALAGIAEFTNKDYNTAFGGKKD